MAADVHATCRLCEAAEANGDTAMPNVALSSACCMCIFGYLVRQSSALRTRKYAGPHNTYMVASYRLCSRGHAMITNLEPLSYYEVLALCPIMT